MSRRILFVMVLMITGQSLEGAVDGFVETFSGTGKFDGLDNPDWRMLTDGVFEDGGLRVTNAHGGRDAFARLLTGRGSFRTTIEIKELFLGDFDVFGGIDTNGRVVIHHDLFPNNDSGDGFSLTLGHWSHGLEGMWSLYFSAAGDSDGGFVPQAVGGTTRIEVFFNDDTSQITAWYDPDVDNGAPAIMFGPIQYSRGFDPAAHTIELGFTSEGQAHADGVLTLFSVQSVSDVLGDFNGNEVLDVADIDLLTGAVQSAENDVDFDLNSDGLVNQDDRTAWVHDLKNTYFGDTNLDGEFTTVDLVLVQQAGQYEDDIVENSSWATGDWNGDGEFNSADFVVAFQDGGYEQGPRVAASVPEPTSAVVLVIGLLLLLRRSKPAWRP